MGLFLIAILCGCSGQVSTDEHSTGVYIEGGVRAVDMQPDKVTEQAREFFANWLRDHGETEIVNDETGVGLARSKARLWAFQYGATDESLEIEFRIVLPDGREIQEFLAGMPAEGDATGMVFVNFCLSTFHTIYATFLNPEDEHVEHIEVTVGGRDFYYTSSGLFAVGGDDLPSFGDTSDQIRKIIESNGPALSNQAHWLKVVYGVAAGEPILSSVTLDNSLEENLTDKIATLNWPTTENFYMAKEFIVLRPR